MRLYHNPRCSKSRQAVALLTERKVEFEDYRYLDNGIDPNDLDILVPLEGVIRTKEVDKSLGYNLNNVADIRKLLIDNPKALERPILIKNGQAVIGRPPENILVLLD
ncbi:MAG: arsenate reductase family protein [Candidatus Poseidoniaceae archaeon]